MAQLPDEGPTFESIGRHECLNLLSTQSVGRIGISLGALPVILPVNFAMLDDSIVFRTVPGTKLDAATRAAVVAFEVDSYESDGRSGWSVLVIGASARMHGDQAVEADGLNIDAWPLDGRAAHFVRIEATQVSGRRFGR